MATFFLLQNAISETFGIHKSQLRVYIHYQPSYYHLHVHFTHLKYNPPGINVERAHLLQSVIANLKHHSNYYDMATLSYMIKKNDGLYSKMSAAGRI